MNVAKSQTPQAVPASDIRCLGSERRAYTPGTLINDRLELRRLQGRGGMGEVWIARHHLLDLDVAVKLIRPDKLSNAAAGRLLREARAAARLSHPAIARVLDFGRTPDMEPYIVMELLHGRSLADLLDRDGRMDAVHAVRMLLPIVHALAAAHRKSIIHRDLKPDNIFLAVNDGGQIEPKLLDFGIALSPGTERTTGKRRVLATPEYASPEQAQALDSVDERADIWALCLVLYECITQQRPFLRESPAQTLRATIQTASFRANAVADPALAAIIERGVRKEPSARWSSMLELGEALVRWLVGRGVHEDISGVTLKTRWPAAARAAAATAATIPDLPRVSSQLPRAAMSVPLLSATATLESLNPSRDSAYSTREPSLVAPRPSDQPEAPEPLRSKLPESGRARWWGLSIDRETE
jgi:eukaryotic-like serine/threonine-protein kinase